MLVNLRDRTSTSASADIVNSTRHQSVSNRNRLRIRWLAKCHHPVFGLVNCVRQTVSLEMNLETPFCNSCSVRAKA